VALVGVSTVVLVHGAWHGPWCWDPVMERLDGVEVRTVDLPSSGPDAARLGGLDDDAAAVRKAIDGADGDVLVVAHSYGGAPVTQGAAGAQNVAHLLYLTAFMLDEGESLFGLVGGVAPEWWILAPDGQSLMPDGPEHLFYNDLPPEQAKEAAARLQPQSVPAVKQPINAAAWKDIPSTYVICDRDNAIPVPAQEMLAQRAGDVRRLDTSHSPFLSKPDEVVAILRELMG
jgi:pimeloyl-ACP methyl ester carboxylesterase